MASPSFSFRRWVIVSGGTTLRCFASVRKADCMSVWVNRSTIQRIGSRICGGARQPFRHPYGGLNDFTSRQGSSIVFPFRPPFLVRLLIYLHAYVVSPRTKACRWTFFQLHPTPPKRLKKQEKFPRPRRLCLWGFGTPSTKNGNGLLLLV